MSKNKSKIKLILFAILSLWLLPCAGFGQSDSTVWQSLSDSEKAELKKAYKKWQSLHYF